MNVTFLGLFTSNDFTAGRAIPEAVSFSIPNTLKKMVQHLLHFDK